MKTKFKSLPEVFENTARKYPKKVFLQIKKGEEYIMYTYEHVY